MKNFWKKLNRPIYALAPMAGITDSAFRQICKSFGADVVYSEMASVAALAYGPKKTLKMLEYNKKEGPYVVQLFGSQPEHFSSAARLVTKKIKPDGIDINFGCPAKKVQKQGAGAALMNNLELARKIIINTISNTNLPVSIKIRSKAGKVDALKFLDNIKDLEIKAVMIHGRTLAQGFSGSVDMEIIKKSRNYFNGIILANGGVIDSGDARQLLLKTGADGIGIARGALGRPWIFSEVKDRKLKTKSYKDIFRIAIKHAQIASKLKEKQGILEMRKHLCWYISGLAKAKKLRKELIKAATLEDIKKVKKIFLD